MWMARLYLRCTGPRSHCCLPTQAPCCLRSCACTCAHVDVCAHVHGYVHAYAHVCVCACMSVCVCACVCVCVCACLCAPQYMRITRHPRGAWVNVHKHACTSKRSRCSSGGSAQSPRFAWKGVSHSKEVTAHHCSVFTNS